MKKKQNLFALASLMLLAIVFTYWLAAFNIRGGGEGFEIGGVVHLAGLTLCFLIAGAIIFAAKGHRLKMALLIAAAGVGGIALTWLDWPLWLELLVVCGGYLAICILYNRRRYGRAVRMINAAAEAYQKDRDGEAYLKALEDCAKVVPGNTPFTTQDMGTVTYQEFLACLKLHVLNDMGRQEERVALIERLRSETRSPGLPKWLDSQE